jgi:hypothetical protein
VASDAYSRYKMLEVDMGDYIIENEKETRMNDRIPDHIIRVCSKQTSDFKVRILDNYYNSFLSHV